MAHLQVQVCRRLEELGGALAGCLPVDGPQQLLLGLGSGVGLGLGLRGSPSLSLSLPLTVSLLLGLVGHKQTDLPYISLISPLCLPYISLLLGLVGHEQADLGEAKVHALQLAHGVYDLQPRHVPAVVGARLAV